MASERRGAHAPTFGALLRRLREAAGLTQEQLAERAGLTAKAISALERGERQRPYPHTVRALAAALGVTDEQRVALLAAIPRRGAQAVAAPPKHMPPPAPFAPALVGREAELAHLRQLFADPAVRLVTITGPGGVGKTHLARTFASAAHFADGVFVVPLAAVTRADEAGGAIARALGLSLAGALDPATQVQQGLRGRVALLLLDNLEQLLGAPAERDDPLLGLLEGILATCPGVRVLATSRERLHLRAEWVVELDGLRVAEGDGADDGAAEQVFLAAMRRSQPAPDDDERRAVRQICRLVGGLPLALELAAAWTATLSCREIARELARSLDLLASSMRDLPARHRSMRAVFAQSWELLGADERSSLARLAVFRGAFGREAAAYIARATLPQLDALVRRSLVRRVAAERYELHPVIRHYSNEQLRAEAAHAAVARRFVDFYLAYAAEAEETLNAADQLRGLDAVAAELDNLREAMRLALADTERSEAGARLCAALQRYWNIRGPYHEGLQWAERFLARPLAPGVRARLLLVVGDVSGLLGDVPRALRAAEQAVALQRQAEDDVGVAQALQLLGSLEGVAGQREQGQAHLEQAVALWRAQGRRRELAIALNSLAMLSWECGELEAALRIYDEATAVARAAGLGIELAVFLVNMGMIEVYQGKPGGGARCAEGLARCMAFGDQLGVAYALEALAAHAGLGGDQRRGAVLLGAAEALRARIQVALEPTYRPCYEHFARTAAGGLDEATWDEQRAAGAALPLAEAVALATQAAA